MGECHMDFLAERSISACAGCMFAHHDPGWDGFIGWPSPPADSCTCASQFSMIDSSAEEPGSTRRLSTPRRGRSWLSMDKEAR